MNDWILLLIPPLLYAVYKIARGYPVYVPLPIGTIRRMLELAKVKPTDTVFDLGSGDGRVVITASKEFGAKVVGVEKNKILAGVSEWRVKRNKLVDKVKIVNQDLFDCDMSKATVVAVYLTQKFNNMLRPKLEKELKHGTRIVSAAHVFKGWKEIEKIRTGHFYTYLYEM